MAEAVEDLAEKSGHTFTDVVVELLRRELEHKGYQMDLGDRIMPQKQDVTTNGVFNSDDNKKASGK